MATRTIPAKTICTCDICGRDMGGVGPSNKLDGGIVIRRSALDYQGVACADAKQNFDACDDCLGMVCAAINTISEKRKEQFSKGGSDAE